MTAPADLSALDSLLRQQAERVERALERWLPAAQIQPTRLHQAMRYAVLAGGKRIRPALVYATGQALGVEAGVLDGPAAAVELIHAYSLVHDDLPAMDDDDLRRGRPTCHRAYDEGTAVLVGDALQSLAFYVLARDEGLAVSAERRLAMIETLAMAAGSRGMAGGQALDLEAVGRSLNPAELENMHIHKTGAILRACVRMAALASPGAAEVTLERLDRYAKCIGLAYQVRDDILDVEGTTERTGKVQGADAARQKPTYPAVLGLARSIELAGQLHEQAMESLSALDARADPLRWLSAFIVQRGH
jgi:farnesyl diphosphate synthase